MGKGKGVPVGIFLRIYFLLRSVQKALMYYPVIGILVFLSRFAQYFGICYSNGAYETHQADA